MSGRTDLVRADPGRDDGYGNRRRENGASGGGEGNNNSAREGNGAPNEGRSLFQSMPMTPPASGPPLPPGLYRSAPSSGYSRPMFGTHDESGSSSTALAVRSGPQTSSSNAVPPSFSGAMANAPPPFLPVRKPKQKVLYTHCVFCQNNGEDETYYMSHTCKDDMGMVTCPVLSAYACPLCGATGPVAHTVKYCPRNKGDRYHENLAPITTLKKMKSSIGRQAVRNHKTNLFQGGFKPVLRCPVPNSESRYVGGGRRLWPDQEPSPWEPVVEEQPLHSRPPPRYYPSSRGSVPTAPMSLLNINSGGGNTGYGSNRNTEVGPMQMTPPDTPWSETQLDGAFFGQGGDRTVGGAVSRMPPPVMPGGPGRPPIRMGTPSFTSPVWGPPDLDMFRDNAIPDMHCPASKNSTVVIQRPPPTTVDMTEDRMLEIAEIVEEEDD